jgi:hypothetical protein
MNIFPEVLMASGYHKLLVAGCAVKGVFGWILFVLCLVFSVFGLLSNVLRMAIFLGPAPLLVTVWAPPSVSVFICMVEVYHDEETPIKICFRWPFIVEGGHVRTTVKSRKSIISKAQFDANSQYPPYNKSLSAC